MTLQTPIRRAFATRHTAFIGLLMASAASAAPDDWPAPAPAVAIDPAIEARIDDLLATMTLEQKVGQTVQAEIRDVTPADVRAFHLGSILNGGGAFPNNDKRATRAEWLALADAFWDASMDGDRGHLAIPVLWGTDAVHGHSNVMGATLFPHNIGLGAGDNPALVEAIGAATAAEVRATGIDWTFAPTVAVARDDRWGRTYESYSEDPVRVSRLGAAMVRGLQGAADGDGFLGADRVLATAKHFIGDGGTRNGVDQGNTVVDEATLRDVHGPGYEAALLEGVQTVMASFNSWNGDKLHGNRYLLTDVLKTRMGFDGLIVGDWNGHGQIPGCDNTACAQAVNAGVDLIMVPSDWRAYYENTVALVKSGDIPQARLDDAVRRILRVKLRAGLFDAPRPSERAGVGDDAVLGNPAHRAIARQAVRESLVLLKNNGGVLPLAADSRVLITGDGADNITQQSGGWTITWQGTDNTNDDFPNAQSIYGGFREALAAGGGEAVLSPDGGFATRPDAAIVVFGETPYAEGQGDRRNLRLDRARQSLAIMESLRDQGIPVVAVFLTGRPLWVNRHINAADAFVVAWLPGSEGGGIADVLIANAAGEPRHEFTGTLPMTWPAGVDGTPINTGQNDPAEAVQFAYGHGLSFADNVMLAALPTDAGEQDADVGVKPLVLFDGRPLAPWSLIVGDEENWYTPVQGARFDSADNRLSVAAVDDQVQEDARRLNWNGRGPAQVYLAGPAQDFTALLEAQSALVFRVRLERPPRGDVTLRMGCQHPCKGEFDISEHLKELPRGKWATLSFDLACFEQNGADMARIDGPFVLLTEGRLRLTTAAMAIVPGMGPLASHSCSR